MEHYELMRDLLARAGIPASDEEIASIAAGYPDARTVVAGLYAVPTGDGAPATAFTSAPEDPPASENPSAPED